MSKQILIVEDNPFIALDLQDTFEGAGYRVLGPVAAVNEGMAILKKHTPDIAMLDYNLGRETSVELAQLLQSRGVPYLFLSGYAEQISIGAQFDDPEVMVKPFDTNNLLERVNIRLSH